MTEAEKEREAITSWLREEAEAHVEGCVAAGKIGNYELAAEHDRWAIQAAHHASSIERGDHHK